MKKKLTTSMLMTGFDGALPAGAVVIPQHKEEAQQLCNMGYLVDADDADQVTHLPAEPHTKPVAPVSLQKPAPWADAKVETADAKVETAEAETAEAETADAKVETPNVETADAKVETAEAKVETPKVVKKR